MTAYYYYWTGDAGEDLDNPLDWDNGPVDPVTKLPDGVPAADDSVEFDTAAGPLTGSISVIYVSVQNNVGLQGSITDTDELNIGPNLTMTQLSALSQIFTFHA